MIRIFFKKRKSGTIKGNKQNEKENILSEWKWKDGNNSFMVIEKKIMKLYLKKIKIKKIIQQ